MPGNSPRFREVIFPLRFRIAFPELRSPRGREARRHRRDQHELAAPAADAGFREFGVVIRDDKDYACFAFQAFFGFLELATQNSSWRRVGISASRFARAQP